MRETTHSVQGSRNEDMKMFGQTAVCVISEIFAWTLTDTFTCSIDRKWVKKSSVPICTSNYPLFTPNFTSEDVIWRAYGRWHFLNSVSSYDTNRSVDFHANIFDITKYIITYVDFTKHINSFCIWNTVNRLYTFARDQSRALALSQEVYFLTWPTPRMVNDCY